MNLFDQLITDALQNKPDLAALRIVVEKELLHHDILRLLSQHNLLTRLTFIGGTCLRACYGGVRLSEDLDFAGGADFSRDELARMGDVLVENLHEKYGLEVKVTEPEKDKSNVDTWKIKIETRPEQRHLPAQRINIDICAVPSYERQPMLLLNPYGVDMGTDGLVVQAQSREEIYSDKILAFALRPNRLKYRDLWDMVWLHQRGVRPHLELIPKKLKDRDLTQGYFMEFYSERCASLSKDESLALEFRKEMQRFLPVEQVNQAIESDNLWSFITFLIGDLEGQVRQKLL